jgi:hypothetical protein
VFSVLVEPAGELYDSDAEKPSTNFRLAEVFGDFLSDFRIRLAPLREPKATRFISRKDAKETGRRKGKSASHR